MKDHSLNIPEPLPVKLALLKIIEYSNYQKEFIAIKITQQHGHKVLKLPLLKVNLKCNLKWNGHA